MSPAPQKINRTAWYRDRHDNHAAATVIVDKGDRDIYLNFTAGGSLFTPANLSPAAARSLAAALLEAAELIDPKTDDTRYALTPAGEAALDAYNATSAAPL